MAFSWAIRTRGSALLVPFLCLPGSSELKDLSSPAVQAVTAASDAQAEQQLLPEFRGGI